MTISEFALEVDNKKQKELQQQCVCRTINIDIIKNITTLIIGGSAIAYIMINAKQGSLVVPANAGIDTAVNTVTSMANKLETGLIVIAGTMLSLNMLREIINNIEHSNIKGVVKAIITSIGIGVALFTGVAALSELFSKYGYKI